MMFRLFAVALCLVAVAAPCWGARILGVVPMPSYSHQIVFQPLWRELSLRGHQVVILVADTINDPTLANLTEIDWHGAYKFWDSLNMADAPNKGQMALMEDWKKVFEEITNYQLGHPDVQALIRNENEHFDLLLVEGFVPAMFAFAERFKCPFIAISSLDGTNIMHEMMQNPSHPIAYPDFMIPFSGKMTFFERLTTVARTLFYSYYNDYVMLPIQQRMVDKYFGNGYSPLMDTMRNVSMMFLNTNPIFHQVRPVVPAVIQIGGGLHIKKSKPLPKDLQRRLDNATEGFIYFSLGTNVKSKDLPESVLQIIMETFAELPYQILWKFELEDLPGKPDNVLISKWFPQQDVFRHPKIKLFITQGGLQSLEEAIYNYVPLIVMPFIGDQPSNARKTESMGFGLSLDYKTLDKEIFKEKILEVITNSRYRKTVKRVADLLNDQQTTGLERAVWWTEYALRHEGGGHLRGSSANLPFYQYIFLDVVGFFAAVLTVLIISIVVLAKVVKRLLLKVLIKTTVKKNKLL